MSIRKVALVTGGGSGIGAAICRRFAADGLAVLVADRDGAHAASVAAVIVEQGGSARATTTDVTNPAEVAAMVAAAVTTFGALDILVCSAGIGIQKPMLATSLEEWNAIIGVNLTGLFLCGKAAAEVMIPRKSGRIINITSAAGHRGIPGRCAYGASKAGAMSLTRVMAVELGPHGITVNDIAPGPIHTPLTDRMHTDETRRAYIAANPLGRYGTLDELAAAAAFLASDGGGYVNGHTLTVDGGMTASGPAFRV